MTCNIILRIFWQFHKTKSTFARLPINCFISKISTDLVYVNSILENLWSVHKNGFLKLFKINCEYYQHLKAEF